MSKLKPQEFHRAISQLLSVKLKPLVTAEKPLNLVTCVEIYTTIFNALVEVVTAADIPLTNESVNYVAQCYYSGVLVNGSQELDPNIFSHLAKLSGIETEELTMLAVMLSGTDFAAPIIAEVKKRS